MGADHSRPAPSAPPGVRRILVATVVPLIGATLIAALALWPWDAPDAAPGTDPARHHGTVTRG